VLISPAAAFLLNSYGVSASSVHASRALPSGKWHVVTKDDALAAVKGKELVGVGSKAKQAEPDAAATSVQAPPKSAPSAQAQSQQRASAAPAVEPLGEGDVSGSFEDVDLTTMRKVIATRLTEAKQSRPHFYASIDCEIDKILGYRKNLKQTLGAAPSINDMIVKAASLAIRDVPRINCRLEADGSVSENKSIDVAVAVATPTGLITPIVKNSDQKGVLQISADMKDLAGRARANKLKLDEFQGGSFTVSNLGMFGISDFTAVISPPQSAILAVGGGRQEFDVSGAEPRAVNLITVQVSADRRLLDDITAAQFLQCFRTYMSDPLLLTL